MKAYTSYKFSVDIQMESVKGHNDFYTEKKQSWHMDKKKIVEPVVHLYCPHAECHEVIDEAVRDIAKHEGAEVLTLDALELASGENSILGDQIQEALSALYKDSTRPDREEKIEAISESDAVTDSSDDTSDEESARKRRRERRRRRKAIEQRKKKAKNELKEKERKKKEEAKKNDMEIQAIFDALVSLSPQDSVAPAKKRIVYIRDFGSIAGVSSPLVVRLLRAIHARRVAKFSDGVESEDLIQPTLLILGYSSSGSDGNIVESTFVHGGTRLRMVLPHIGAGSLGHGSFTSITLSPISSQFFSRTLVVKKEYPKDDSDYSDNDIEYRPDYGRRLLDYPYNPALRTTVAPPYERTWMPYDATDDNPILSLGGFDLSSASLAMSVFFKGEEKKALTSLEESLCDRRTTDIANAWFKLSLTQRKRRLTCDDVITFLGNDEDLQKELARDNDKDREEKRMKKERARFTIQVIGENKSKKTSKKAKGPRGPYKGQALLARLAEFVDSSISVTLDKGVAIVLGLSSSGQTSGSADVPEVPLSDFSKAFQTLIHGHQSRAEWWKKEPNSDDKTDDSNDSGKDEDPVVKSVKEATDLTSHEKGLLSSIVDPSTSNLIFQQIVFL
ncbi:hypothetical protein BDQ17DRAFT_651471 [Cyathus striatus]|nr:hypothetical protein BDQ17DRAFT_651471 [Cyathus striatus]